MLERSNDGIHFIALSNLSASWKTINGSHIYTDAQPLQGNNFYRLNVVDNDGKQATSGIVLLAINHVIKINVFPNPFKNSVTIQGDAGTYLLTVTNVSGKTILNKNININGAGITLPFYNMAKGVYYFVLKDAAGNIINSQKLIKQ